MDFNGGGYGFLGSGPIKSLVLDAIGLFNGSIKEVLLVFEL